MVKTDNSLVKLAFLGYNIAMKINNLLFCITFASLLLFSACATRTRDFSSRAPLALVTVVSNQYIYWYGETPSGTGGAAVSSFVRDTLGLRGENESVRISRAGELINEADAMLRQVISDAGVFGLVDKDLVINSRSYATAGSDSPARRGGPRMVAAEGYRFIQHNDRQFAAQLAQELGVNSLLFVTFDFSKEMASGFGRIGTGRARVAMDAVLVDSSGRRLFSDEIVAVSAERIRIRNGAYYEEELMDLLREAIGIACFRFIWQFAGTQPN